MSDIPLPEYQVLYHETNMQAMRVHVERLCAQASLLVRQLSHTNSALVYPFDPTGYERLQADIEAMLMLDIALTKWLRNYTE